MTNQPQTAPTAPDNDAAPKQVEPANETKQAEPIAAPIEQPAAVEPTKI